MEEQPSRVGLRCRFWFPQAQKVKVLFGDATIPPEATDDEFWEAEVPVERGVRAYRFVVDDVWVFPDPYNAAYCVRDGVYHSVLNSDRGFFDSFPEQPESLIVTNSLAEPSDLHPVGVYGPADHAVYAVLTIRGTVREHNHVAWLWTSPTGHLAMRTHIPVGNSEVFFASEPMEAFFEPGVWRVSAFFNGRSCGEVSFRVKSDNKTGIGSFPTVGG